MSLPEDPGPTPPPKESRHQESPRWAFEHQADFLLGCGCFLFLILLLNLIIWLVLKLF